MKKAVFFSFLIHALIFFLAVYFLPEPVKQNVYRVLTVSIRPEAVPEMVLEEVVQETGALPDVGPQTVPKKKELLETEQKTALDTVEPILRESAADESLPKEYIPDSIDSFTADSGIIEEEQSPAVFQSGQEKMKDNTQDGSMPQDDIHTNQLEIQWTNGNERGLLNGDSPEVDISRNSLLMDTVRIIFLVQNDGSVTNVRILPPGSNSFQVDRQLREWANLLLFEKQEENKQSAEAVITIHLKAREFSLP